MKGLGLGIILGLGILARRGFVISVVVLIAGFGLFGVSFERGCEFELGLLKGLRSGLEMGLGFGL